MAEATVFDEFVTARSSRLLRLAHLLTGDHALAEDLLQTALVRSWSVWRRVQGDPEPYVRRVMVNTYNSWWRRRWNHERPTGDLPEMSAPAPQEAVDARDEVWRALDRLPRQQRAVLVLRYFEDLSEAQIAEALGISPGAVKGYSAKAMARLRLDPSLLPEPPQPPEGTERLAGVRERIRARRRQRLVVIGAACAVVAALILGYAVVPRLFPVALSDPADRKIAGFAEYRDGYHIVAAGRGPLADRERLTAVWTPTAATGYMVTGGCAHHELGVRLKVTVRVNGRVAFGSWCDAGRDEPTGDAQTLHTLDSLGVRVGEPATVTVSIDEAVKDSTPSGPNASPVPVSVPAKGTIAFAIGEAVPFADYPFPPRPKKLAPLPRPTSVGKQPLAVLEAHGSHQVTLPSNTTKYEVEGSARSPMLLHVQVNGVRVFTMGWWTYQPKLSGWEFDRDVLAKHGVTVTGTDPITLTIEPEHTTDDWYVSVFPARQ